MLAAPHRPFGTALPQRDFRDPAAGQRVPACLPLRTGPVPGARQARPALPGTVPFADAAQAWFWTVAALAARRDGTGGGGRGGGGARTPRPCDPDDVIRALDLLYRRGGIGPAHARVLRRWGERFTPPTAPSAGGTPDAALWAEAMERLDGILRAKGIIG